MQKTLTAARPNIVCVLMFYLVIKSRGISDPHEVIFKQSKEERKTFYRTIGEHEIFLVALQVKETYPESERFRLSFNLKLLIANHNQF